MFGRTWRERLLDLALPRVCAACAEDLPPPMSGPLCGACLGALRPLDGPEEEEGLPEGVEALRALFPYRRPLPRLLYAFKYGGSLLAGRSLGDWLAGAFPRYPELRGAQALVPVPLHPSRQRLRGFNQARLLAERVSRASGLPVFDALSRSRRTAAQWRFGREARARRLKTVFAPAAPVAGMRLILIDDVCTSGGTLAGCARALKEAGAARVAAYVLSRG